VPAPEVYTPTLRKRVTKGKVKVKQEANQELEVKQEAEEEPQELSPTASTLQASIPALRNPPNDDHAAKASQGGLLPLPELPRPSVWALAPGHRRNKTLRKMPSKHVGRRTLARSPGRQRRPQSSP
jgi:hypothetical protein